jgi:predicted DsbA family dithiol-disulfide isomerase
VRAEDPLAALMKIARLAGVSAEEFNAIMRNRELLEAIVALRQEGTDDWQIASTPSFVINDDEVLSGNMTYEDFAERLSAFGA